MEEEEAGPTVRRTRSAKAATKVSPVVKQVKHKPGPLSRRTRKKVVLMEVEVSDEDEETPHEDKSSTDAAEEEKKMEERLLESPDESNDSVEKKNVTTAGKRKDRTDNDSDEEKNELNGNGRNSKNIKLDDSITVVFNDVEMLEETEVESEEKDVDKGNKDDKKKMDEDEEKCVVKTKSIENEESKKEITKEVKLEAESKEQPELVSSKKELKVEISLVEKIQTDTPKEEETKTATSIQKESEPEKKKVRTETSEKEKPETSTGEEPKPETSTGEEPKPESPKKEEPKAETPKKEEHKAETPKKEEPKVEATQKEEPEVETTDKDELEKKSSKKVSDAESSIEKTSEHKTEKSTLKKNEPEKEVNEKKEKGLGKPSEMNESTADSSRKVEKGIEPDTTITEEKHEESCSKDVKTETFPEEIKPNLTTEEKTKQEVSEEKSELKDTEQLETSTELPVIEPKTETALEAKKSVPEATTESEEKKTPIVSEELEKVKENEEVEEKSERKEAGKELPKEKEEAAEEQIVSCKLKEEKILVTEISKMEVDEILEKEAKREKSIDAKEKGDPDAENISEDELPTVQAAKVPEAEEVSDEELPGPKRAELPADTEVVSEDELPTVKNEEKKEGVKRKLDATDYDPGSPTSENEAPAKKPSLEPSAEKEKEKEEKPVKPKKLPELDKYWKAVNDDPTDFTGWTYLLQYVDQENDMEAAREAYDAFLSHYPYCYGYWRKYADYEKRKGNKKKCEEVFERGLKAIPLSVDLWIHYLTYVKSTRADDEEFIRSQFERSISACGLEFRSDRLWDSFIKWETEGKRLQRVTAIYDRLLATPTQGYTSHFDNFQEHIASNPPNKVIEVDEFLALRKEVKHMLKHDVTTDAPADEGDAPPGDEDQSKVISSDEETKSIRERIVSIRRKVHKATVNAVTARWNYEEGIKRPYFHVKPLERCQLKNWQDYLDYETEQGDRVRIIVLFERCLIACALYEEFWLKFVHYLEGLKDKEMQSKIRDVYERACTIHHLKKPSLHLQWALFEEEAENPNRAAEILVNLEKSVPNILQIAYRRINLERRRNDYEKCCQLYEHYINNSKNKMISSNVAIKYSRFCFRVMKDMAKAQEALKTAITKDPNNPRLYLQLIDLALQKENVSQAEVIEIIDSFLDKESTDIEQKVLFAQRKLEYVEDFGCDVASVQVAYDQYQKVLKQGKDSIKKKETKSETSAPSKKEKPTVQSSSQSSTYNYGAYGNSSAQPAYPYSGSQQQGQNYYQQYGQGSDQYQYQNWQYPQGGYGGYNQWGGYGGGYGY